MNPDHSLSISTSPQPDVAAYIGIDWSDRKHDICIYDIASQTRKSLQLDHRAELIEEWVNGLREHYNGQSIAIGLEQKQGSLIYTLHKYEFLILYPINPRTVAKYHQAFKSSRAKDDPTDADLLLELLLKHGDKLAAWQPSSPQVRKLAQLVESRRTLVGEKVRFKVDPSS
jgi:transposase